MSDNIKDGQYYADDGAIYDEAFICRAVAIAHSRSWSNPAIAAALCIPAELLDDWIRDYSDRIEVHYLEDVRVKKKQAKGMAAGIKLERCPGCNTDVVFEPVKAFEVQREEGVDIGTKNDVMNSGDDGILGFKVPYVRILTEYVMRCPACGAYTIQNVTEKLTKSEAQK